MNSKHSLNVLALLVACGSVLQAPQAWTQNAAPADRNVVNTATRPGDMMADSPVTFPKEGPIPAKYPPDVRERSEPAEEGYYLYGEQILARIPMAFWTSTPPESNNALSTPKDAPVANPGRTPRQ